MGILFFSPFLVRCEPPPSAGRRKKIDPVFALAWLVILRDRDANYTDGSVIIPISAKTTAYARKKQNKCNAKSLGTRFHRSSVRQQIQHRIQLGFLRRCETATTQQKYSGRRPQKRS